MANHTLRNQISSAYIKASNKLYGKKARQRIVAYVESYDDIYFWRMLLSGFENDTRYFEVMLPSKQKLSKGKKAVLMNLLSEQVGKQMIACVDADYDYLLDSATEISKQVNHNPYVFHTYAYAIENLQCYANSLHDICVSATLNDYRLFDFKAYLANYSLAIYPLFVWNLWCYRYGKHQNFSISDFTKVIQIGHFSLDTAFEAIERVKRKVANAVKTLRHTYPNAQKSYTELESSLRQKGVTPDTTYLYIQGHYLFDEVVVPALTTVCRLLIERRENEIKSKAKHFVQRENELSNYEHSIENIVSVLKRHMGYLAAPQTQQIVHDLEKFLQT